MLLRAGRFYVTKPLFYIIMTLLDDDESEEIQFVLEALTKYDVYFDQQILKRILQTNEANKPVQPKGPLEDELGLDDKIQTTSVNWNDIPAIRKVFMNLIKRRTSRGTPYQQIHAIRKLCKQQKISSSSAYNKVRLLTGWIEEPWLKRNMTAYDFFHDENDEHRLSQDDFRRKIAEQGIQSTDAYDVWFSKAGAGYPSIEYINDGYFGKNSTNLQLFLPNGPGRRR